MHIGQRIKEIMEQRHCSVVSVARQLSCERTNVYNIFKRKSLDVRLLMRISVILEYDFFKELSEEAFPVKK
jgi:transcriptional regulator with XRE-family HTH domain